MKYNKICLKREPQPKFIGRLKKSISKKINNNWKWNLNDIV